MARKKAPPTRLLKKKRGRIVSIEEQNPAATDVKSLKEALAKRKKRTKKK
jgi:hypothetical protein